MHANKILTGDLYCSIMGQDVGFRSSTQPTEEWNKNNSNWYYLLLMLLGG